MSLPAKVDSFPGVFIQFWSACILIIDQLLQMIPAEMSWYGIMIQNNQCYSPEFCCWRCETLACSTVQCDMAASLYSSAPVNTVLLKNNKQYLLCNASSFKKQQPCIYIYTRTPSVCTSENPTR